MLQIFHLTLEKVAVLLLYVAVGYFLRRGRLLPADTARVLSTLCTALFIPAYIFQSLGRNFTRDTLGENGALALSGLAWMVGGGILAFLFARLLGKTALERSTLTYVFTFPNTGYFGYPVIEGVFGQAALAKMIVFLLPFAIGTYTYGYALFEKQEGGWKAMLLRVLKAPSVLAVALGVAAGLAGLKLPGVVDGMLTGLSDCMSPASMLLAGFVLGGYPLKDLFRGARGYLAVAVRMLLFPALGLALCLLLRPKGWLFLFPAAIMGMPMGLNAVVFPESRGEDVSATARMVFQSTLLAIITLPPFFALLFRLAGLE